LQIANIWASTAIFIIGMKMATGVPKIEQDVLNDLEEQYNHRQSQSIPEDVREDLEEKYNIRQGVYPNDTAFGLAQSGIGALENLGQMFTGFFAAVPGAVAGTGAAIIDRDAQSYVDVFDKVTAPLTYDPRSKKGKIYQEAIAGAYDEWINERWGDHVGELVEQGYISPEEATWMRVSADALLLGLPIKAAKSVRGLKRKAGRHKEVEVEPLEGEYMSAERGGLPAKRQGKIYEQTKELAKKSFDEAAPKRLPPPPIKENIFSSRQAGAVDLSVVAEGVRKALRPLEVGAKAGIDVSHAVARQVGFKHLTDIRKMPSPTAKMLADRIMPSQSSTIPLGAGFHELISLREGTYNTRLDMAIAPLRKHVANKNSLSSLRVVALPKSVNEGIIRGLETGRAPENLVPAIRAIRSILSEVLEYQREAGVNVAERPNYFPHLWNSRKIVDAEWGKFDKGGGKFTKHLTEDLGIPKEAAADIVRTLVREEGFLDFIDDTGGRLRKGDDYGAWSRAHRVGGGPSTPPHVKRRVIDTTVEKSGDWMITDLESVLNNYINRAVQKAEYTRIAGIGEHRLNRIVHQIIDEMDVTGKLVEQPHTVAQKIYDVFDAMQYRFKSIENPSVLRLNRAASGYEVMAHLGLVTLAQFPETLIPAVKYRVATPTKAAPSIPLPLKSYAVGMASAVQDAISSASTVLTGKRVIPKSEIRKHLERVGVVKVSTLESSAARMMRTTGKLTNRFLRLVFMEGVTDMQRAISFDTIQSMIRQNARYLSKGLAQGKRKVMYEQELVELGLDPKEVVDWYRKGMPNDHPISENLDIAAVRAVNNTTIMPKSANTPRLYNDPRFQLPLLFTRFFTVFGNTVIKKVFNDLVSNTRTTPRKIASIAAVATSIGVAYYTQFLRESISGYQYRDEDDPMRIIDAVDRAGWVAMFTRLYPLLVGEYRYQLGPSYVANILGGPVGTDVAKAIEAAKLSLSKGDVEPAAKWMASMTPIANITPEIEEQLVEFYTELLEGLE
jgi:hypothetical protein